jgi:tRNA-Thr(GGU) m(6)t(6)A37 methyltransferase TsaA
MPIRKHVELYEGEVRLGEHGYNGTPSKNQGAVMMTTPYEIRPIGYVESPLVARETAPKQGYEGAPDAWLAFNPEVAEGIRDLAVGTEVFVLTWLHHAQRDVLAVHPRDDPRNPETGVFSTRSQDRPNPIGLHRVQIVAIDGPCVLVRDLEAFDGTPIVDVKPVLAGGR